MNQQMPQKSDDFFAFQGGLDQSTPALRVPAGSVIDSYNYTPNTMGGYSRCDGYEAFDGRARPSDAIYTLVACTMIATPTVGATVTIGAATGLFVKLVDGGVCLTGVVGTIPASTTMTTAGPVTVGTTASSITLTTGVTAAEEAQHLVDSADVYRALIVKPVGSGAIRGVCMYNGSVYCFRDNAGGTAGQMWKSTSSGWSLVALNEEVSFSNANTSVGEGDTLTQGGNTALILRVVLETGTLASGVNTGRLIISGRAPGNFAAGAATSTGGGNLTLSAIQTAITLPVGGHYTFDIYNFYGQLTTRRMYGANGVSRCFEFDGTVFVPLSTGQAVDTPSFLRVHNKYLYVSIGSSLMNGSVGNPYRWVASEGAVESAVGDTITGLSVLPSALAVMCRNSSYALTGKSTADWSLDPIRADVGAVPYTLADMSTTFMLDDRGVTSISAVQEFGNFSDATLSRKIQPLIDAMRGTVVDAYISRTKGHYVLLRDDGSTLTMGVNGGRSIGFLPGLLGFIPSCAFSGEDSSGIERIFVGGTDGHVYEMGRGSTFDGEAIEASLKIFYYNSRSPRVRKRYRRLTLEMSAVLYASIQFSAEYSYGDPDVKQTINETAEVAGSGGSWDSVDWDEFFWDSQDISQPSLRLTGTGLNLALSFYSNTKLDFGHVLQGAMINFTPRRQER